MPAAPPAPPALPPDTPDADAPSADGVSIADRRRNEAVFFSDYFGRVGSPEPSRSGAGRDGKSDATSDDDAEARLRYVTDMMREVSRQRTPADLVNVYGEHMRRMLPLDRLLTISRRGEPPGRWRITRDRHFDENGRDVEPPTPPDGDDGDDGGLIDVGAGVADRLGPSSAAMIASTFGSADAPDPWRDRDRQPAFDGGLLGDLLHGNRPAYISDVAAEVSAGRIAPGDPARRLLAGYRSLLALPLFDDGEALNMAVMMRRGPDAFPRGHVAQHVLISNLFGRATSNLVLGEELKANAEELKTKAEELKVTAVQLERYAADLRAANDATDRELSVVAQMQRSFLPADLPAGHGLDLAAHYQTAKHAGGDYYDFFPLPAGKLGILIADVSGHGAAAAVLMAVTHSIAHAFPVDPGRPAAFLAHLNRGLTDRYTGETGTFVTAFYAVFDPATGTLTHCSAGHNPPRVKPGCGAAPYEIVGESRHLPLGIDAAEPYADAEAQLHAGDLLVLYTDGITEAHGAPGPDGSSEMFGTPRLDAVLARCGLSPQAVIDQTLAAVDAFTGGAAPTDDRTLLVAKVG